MADAWGPFKNNSIDAIVVIMFMNTCRRPTKWWINPSVLKENDSVIFQQEQNMSWWKALSSSLPLLASQAPCPFLLRLTGKEIFIMRSIFPLEDWRSWSKKFKSTITLFRSSKNPEKFYASDLFERKTFFTNDSSVSSLSLSMIPTYIWYWRKSDSRRRYQKILDAVVAIIFSFWERVLGKLGPVKEASLAWNLASRAVHPELRAAFLSSMAWYLITLKLGIALPWFET